MAKTVEISEEDFQRDARLRDRVAKLLAHGFRVRHARDVMVLISARLSGRAAGGVADTIRSRCEEPDALCDARMEAFPRAVSRYLWRRRLRRLHEAGRLGRDLGWARRLGIAPEEAQRIAALPQPGMAIAAAEIASPRLPYRPLGPRELPGQIRLGRLMLVPIRVATWLRDRGSRAAEARRSGARTAGSWPQAPSPAGKPEG